MTKVVGISFKNKGRQYYFNAGELELKKGNKVIVETERGLQYGTVETALLNLEDTQITSPLKDVIRIATNKDQKAYERNLTDAKKALSKARDLAKKYNLNIYLIDASFTFEREQLLFHFLSDGRVDFRALAKDLASIYHTRIELRQIGARDKAKEVGGLGLCGRTLCCAQFLNDFDSVSINMAKNQNIALNPSKINGACGRLLCCLKYEDDTYKEARKNCPKIGSKYKTGKGEGTVTSVDLLNQTCEVELSKYGTIEVSIKNEKA